MPSCQCFNNVLLYFSLAGGIVLKTSFPSPIIAIYILLFFVIIATLYSQNDIETENPIIITGASVIDSLTKDGFFETIEGKFEEIKQDISNSFS